MAGRRGHRLLRAVAAIVVAVGAVVGAVQPAPGQPVLEIHRVERAVFEPGVGGPVFVLVVGTDYRPGVDGHRADAIHLVGVNPAAGAATIVNIPRDTWVDIPGFGPNRINAAHSFGGPQLLAASVERLTGVLAPVVVVTDFAGFTAMVDELGGVPVPVGEPMADGGSGAYFPSGVVHMDGAQALAFSRNRHLRGGDLTRTANQAHLLIHALAELRRDGAGRHDLARYLGVLLRHARVEGVGIRDLYTLGRLALSLDPARVRNVTVPSRVATIGRSSVVVPVAPAAELLADVRDDGLLQGF